MHSGALTVAGVVGLAAGVAAGQGDRVLQRLDVGIEVSPVAVAPAVWGPGGLQSVGDWIPYGWGVRREPREMVFDCIRGTGDCAGGIVFGGTGYCNMFVTNDMTVGADTDLDRGLERLDFAWYWTCDGFGTETCIIGIWTQDSVPCDPDSFEYDGWLLNFGTLSCNPGGYYYTNADLSSVSGTWPVPTNGTGSYAVAFGQEVTSSGTLVLATCAQPMLWATGEDRGDPGARGTQGPEQLDDTLVADGSHTSSECYSYSIAECPYELGVAAGFWGYLNNPCAYSDCNGDGTVNTQDFACFFNLWVPKDPGADCDNDGTVNTQDFTCFLNQWVTCR